MKYNKAINSYISYCFESHEVKTHKKYPDSLFWVKDGEVIVEIEKQEYFWLHIDIWDSISRMFELDYDGTQSVIKEWLELRYNLGGLTPYSLSTAAPFSLELRYNLGELTPKTEQGYGDDPLELHYNLGD